ncbi:MULTISPECIES: GntP family permease [unclassified Microbacterium]|uniref:GntP family permease n=1 Tax=unclassified Microbacterium TaxID=2609290 RepID=UPI0012F7D94E|nr:gluconate:H+ symporter [Microbacterium sp. MAH-37]MVQ41018.1 gluconate transporter [Microbacterium sp. MAH-37]
MHVSLSSGSAVLGGLLPFADPVKPAAGTTQLIIAAIVSIAVIVVLIVWVKMHPFFALMLGAAVMAIAANMGFEHAFTSFSLGLGSTVGGVGVLIVLGAVIGRFLTESGGADEIVDTILAKTPLKRLPWAMAFAAFIIGIPLFFEVGVVLLIPIVMLVAKRAKLPVILVGIPALAGLSALHGLVPPHPGPLIAIDALGANLGLTLAFGLLVAIPTVIIAGPVLAKPMARWVPIQATSQLLTAVDDRDGEERRRPSFGVALSVVLLPVVLMLLMTVVEATGIDDSLFGQILVWIGTPLQALLITSLYAMIVLGTALGRSMAEVSKETGAAFAPIASILLIVGAGGGFKQTLVDSGVGQVIGNGIAGSGIPLLIAGWLVAVVIRLATGSATVATITAAGIMAPLVGDLSATHVALMVLSIGAGSVFLSHVNDAGFWLVKEYFGLTVGQTFKTWSLMECAVSVVGLAGVLVLGLIV